MRRKPSRLLVVVKDVEQLDAVLGHVRDRVHHQEREADQRAGRVAHRIDQCVDVVRRQRARPQVHVAGAAHRRADVAVEVERRHGERQPRDLLREQRRVAGREHAALADAYQVDLGSMPSRCAARRRRSCRDSPTRSRRWSASAEPASGCPSRGSRHRCLRRGACAQTSVRSPDRSSDSCRRARRRSAPRCRCCFDAVGRQRQSRTMSSL